MMSQRGDTIIEVIMAMTIFSLVAVGAMSVMNQGTNSAQRAIETTLVKQQIDAQAEALRAANLAYFDAKKGNGDTDIKSTAWYTITNSAPADFASSDDNCSLPQNNNFVFDPSSAKLLNAANIKDSNDINAPAYAKVVEAEREKTAYGLSIQPKNVSKPDFPNAYDFKISACWYSPGLNVPSTLQTIVRLYAS